MKSILLLLLILSVHCVNTFGQADLIVKPKLEISEIDPGARLTMRGQMLNIGDAPTAVIGDVGYFLSTDQVYDEDDILLSTFGFVSLAAGDSVNITKVFEMPDTTASGDYYIITVADFREETPEIDETNNTGSNPIFVREKFVDLSIQRPNESAGAGIVIPNAEEYGFEPTLEIYNSINADCGVVNDGSDDSGPYTIAFYRSDDDVFDSAEDLLLAEFDYASIPPFSTFSCEQRFPIDPLTPVGDYYLIREIKLSGGTTDLNLTNNVAIAPLTVAETGFDFWMKELNEVPDTLFQGTEVTSRATWANLRGGRYGDLNLTVFLSQDTLFDGFDDIEVGFGRPNRIILGERETIDVFLRIIEERDIPPSGMYYILYVLNFQEFELEFDYSNNILFQPIVVVTDSSSLTTNIDLDLPEELESGDAVLVNIDIGNIGFQEFDDRHLVASFSRNDLLEPSDQIVYSQKLSTIEANSTRTEQVEFTIDDSFEAGDFNLFIYLDNDGMYSFGEVPEQIDTLASSISAVTSLKGYDDFKVKLFPNPVNDVLQLSSALGLEYLHIYNAKGEGVLSYYFTSKDETSKTIRLENLPDGLYFLEVGSGGEPSTKKFLLRR
ncbi:MAG: CARDB domain-containing protein [Bacteroidota bacterium]